MEYLVIYDTEGNIISMASGAVLDPAGIPFMRITIPDRKVLSKIDVTVTPNVPIFTDLPKSEIELLKDKVADLTKQLTDEKAAKLMLLEAMAETYEAVLPFLPDGQ